MTAPRDARSEPRHDTLDSTVHAKSPVTSLSAWEWQEPLPQGNTLHAVTEGKKLYIAVGDAGTVLFASSLPGEFVTSLDARSWTPVAPIIRESLFDVVFGERREGKRAEASAGEGVFVAVGASGTVIRSTDGKRWTAVDSGTNADLRRITYGRHGFVAVGGTTLVTSPDGLAWKIVDTDVDPPGEGVFPPSFHSVRYGNGQYVALVDLGPDLAKPGDEARVLISTDAVQWQTHPFTAPAGSDWAGGGMFFRALAFGEGYFVSAGINFYGFGFTFRSRDGVAWEWKLAPSDQNFTYYLRGDGIAYDVVNARFVAVADVNDPPLPRNPFPSILFSEDGGTWLPQPSPVGPQIETISFARARLIGLTSSSEIYSSVDGSAWAPTTAPARVSRLTGLLTNGSTMITSGWGPAAFPTFPDSSVGLILVSVDRSTWNAATLPVPEDFVVTRIHELAQGGGVFVACAEETPVAGSSATAQRALYISNDGVRWRRIDLQGLGAIEAIIGAAYGNGVFVVTAYDDHYLPVVLRSVDRGATWQRHVVAGIDTIFGTVVHGDGGFVAISYDFGTMVFRSSDGLQWTGVDAWAASMGGGRLVDVAYHDGTYLVSSQAFENGQPTDRLLRSTDGGQSWQASPATNYVLDGLSSNRSGFVVGTRGGDVLFSGDGNRWTASWSGAHSGAVGSVEDDSGQLWIATGSGGVLKRIRPAPRQ